MEIVSQEGGLSLSEIALKAGIVPSTTHRILTTLQQHRYLRFDEERDLWFIGVTAFRVGNSFLRTRKISEIGRKAMRGLLNETGETVNLAIVDEDSVVYVSQMESHEQIRAFHRPGTRDPLHATAAGKLFLASRSEKEVERILHRTGLPAYTPDTITDPKALLAELELTRERGWAANCGEKTSGLTSVAAPILDHYSETIASLIISGPTDRVGGDHMFELAPVVKRFADMITDEIGGRVPPEH